MRTDYAYPSDGVLNGRPPKNPSNIPRLPDDTRWVLPSGHGHPSREAPEAGILRRIVESYTGDSFFRIADAGRATYCRGAVLNTPTPVGKPVILLGVPGIDHDVLPWIVGTVLRRTDHTEVVVRVLWTPDDAVEAVGRVYRGDRWVRIVDTPPMDFMPVKGDDGEALALKREARGRWLRWAAVWVALVTEGTERRWHDALTQMVEKVDYTPTPLEWTRVESVTATVPTSITVPDEAVTGTGPAPGALAVESYALAQVRLRVPVDFTATDPNDHETPPDDLIAILRRWNRHANLIASTPETPHLSIL